MTITFAQLPESARWGHSLCLHRIRPSGARRLSCPVRGELPEIETDVRTVELPIHVYDTGVVRIRVAFDPDTQTLYLGDGGDGLALRRAQDDRDQARDVAGWALARLGRVAALLDHLKRDRPSGVRRRAMRSIREAVGL